MAGLANESDRKTEVWARLATVVDPELDESIADLGFVKSVELQEGDVVHIEFRLPTYWCAANFSFLMADDIRKAVSGLPWVRRVTVVLDEHMYGEQINAGLAKGLSFQETFGAEADGDLEDLRHTFLIKAFQRRQMLLLNHLVSAGNTPASLFVLTIGELQAMPLDEAGGDLVRRYLERRHVAGPSRFDELAFVTADGEALSSRGYSGYVAGLRSVALNVEFNSMICRGLLAARYNDGESKRSCVAGCGGGCSGPAVASR